MSQENGTLKKQIDMSEEEIDKALDAMGSTRAMSWCVKHGLWKKFWERLLDFEVLDRGGIHEDYVFIDLLREEDLNDRTIPPYLYFESDSPFEKLRIRFHGRRAPKHSISLLGLSSELGLDPTILILEILKKIVCVDPKVKHRGNDFYYLSSVLQLLDYQSLSGEEEELYDSARRWFLVYRLHRDGDVWTPYIHEPTPDVFPSQYAGLISKDCEAQAAAVVECFRDLGVSDGEIAGEFLEAAEAISDTIMIGLFYPLVHAFSLLEINTTEYVKRFQDVLRKNFFSRLYDSMRFEGQPQGWWKGTLKYLFKMTSYFDYSLEPEKFEEDRGRYERILVRLLEEGYDLDCVFEVMKGAYGYSSLEDIDSGVFMARVSFALRSGSLESAADLASKFKLGVDDISDPELGEKLRLAFKMFPVSEEAVVR